MIVMGGWLKGKAVLFAVMGVVFIVAGLMMPSFVRSTFIIIGVADLAAAAFSFWMAKSTEPKQDPNAGSGTTWVG
jgi:membrane-bound ClpP family serine protease